MVVEAISLGAERNRIQELVFIYISFMYIGLHLYYTMELLTTVLLKVNRIWDFYTILHLALFLRTHWERVIVRRINHYSPTEV